MAKNGRQGSGSLPDGQPHRGTIGASSVNPKSHPKPDSIGKGEGVAQASRGWPGGSSANTAKRGGSLSAPDSALNERYSYDTLPAPSTTDVGGNRQRTIGGET